MLEIAGVTDFEDVREKGAILIVRINWVCKHKNKCERGIEVDRLDMISSQGASVSKIDMGSDEDTRRLRIGRGIRLFVEVKGWNFEYDVIKICLLVVTLVGVLLIV